MASYTNQPGVIIIDCDVTRICTIDHCQAEREYKQNRRPVIRYHSFMYQAGSWELPQKVIVKVEVSAIGANIRYIVITLPNSGQKNFTKRGIVPGGN